MTCLLTHFDPILHPWLRYSEQENGDYCTPYVILATSDTMDLDRDILMLLSETTDRTGGVWTTFKPERITMNISIQ